LGDDRELDPNGRAMIYAAGMAATLMRHPMSEKVIADYIATLPPPPPSAQVYFRHDLENFTHNIPQARTWGGSTTELHELTDRVVGILERRWHGVEVLARELQDRELIPGDEVHRIFENDQQYHPARREPFALATA
jgi:hypothetical protein